MVWVARLASESEVAEVMADPDSAYDFVNPEDEREAEVAVTVDLDKEWHLTHHLLTGSPEATSSPLSLILGDFQEVGEDNGYGPAVYIPPKALQAFAANVTSLDRDALRRRFNPEGMIRDQVYLADVVNDEGEEAFEFLQERVEDLRQFAMRGRRPASALLR